MEKRTQSAPATAHPLSGGSRCLPCLPQHPATQRRSSANRKPQKAGALSSLPTHLSPHTHLELSLLQLGCWRLLPAPPGSWPQSRLSRSHAMGLQAFGYSSRLYKFAEKSMPLASYLSWQPNFFGERCCKLFTVK